jgi:hypothetical protein
MVSAAPNDIAVNGWVSVLTPLAIAILTVITTVVGYFTARRASEAKAAAVEVKQTLATSTEETRVSLANAADAVEKVKTTLVDTSRRQEQKLREIHSFVNGDYGVALRIAATALESLAAYTKQPGDVKAASAQRHLADLHDEQERQVKNMVEPTL